jgi:uncharacterized protein
MAEFEHYFEWDLAKAAANLRKHGVSFERAATVFQDQESLSLYDRTHSSPGEDRWITLGMDAHGQLLVVCHTWRELAGGAVRCRIISARKATRSEARQYRAR